MEVYEGSLVATSISLISASAVIYCCIFNKHVQPLVGIQLIIVLEVLDLLISLTIYIPTPMYPNNNIMCTIQGVALQYLCVCEFLWTGFISAQLY